MLVRPWFALAMFALVVIPLGWLLVRGVPRSWRSTLRKPIGPVVWNTVVVAAIIVVALLANR